mmetsp:Transcript_19526/g.30020  ORF Transcript_19526/g.30020 Transcript_19526/m.30020 type:complete len:108 (+) Transcript_19526:1202-1525(+)
MNSQSRNMGNNIQTLQPPSLGTQGDETKPIIKTVKSKGPKQSKSRLQEYLDQQGHDIGGDSGGYDEDNFESDGMNAHIKLKGPKNPKSRKSKMNNGQINSDLEGTGD